MTIDSLQISLNRDSFLGPLKYQKYPNLHQHELKKLTNKTWFCKTAALQGDKWPYTWVTGVVKPPIIKDLWAPTYSWRFWAHLISPTWDSVDVTPAAQEEIKLLVEERSLQAQPKKIGLRLGGSSEPPKKPSDTFHEILLLLNRDPYNPHITG